MDAKNIVVSTFIFTVFTSTTGFSFVQLCEKRRGLNDAQVAMCYQHRNTFMPLVIQAQQMTLEECQEQFAGRKWNCTFQRTWEVPHLIKPPMKLPNKETAYISALSTSAIMHKVSRACYENKLKEFCGCSGEPRPSDLPDKDIWGGCGDNLEYGYEFSKKFVDASETTENKDDNRLAQVMMNLHNNEAGRLAVVDKSIIQCRCYGQTANCATKTCYRQLGHFRDVAAHLQELHQSSVPVQLQRIKDENLVGGNNNMGGNQKVALVPKYSDYNMFTQRDLLYLAESPNYCEKNETLSIFGTKGRKCVKNEKSLNDCKVLCCGRGFFTRREILQEKCACEYVYGDVQCKICEREENIYYCK